MTRACCPSCRLRFSRAAAHLTNCPECGERLRAGGAAAETLGYRLFDAVDTPREFPIAVEAALPSLLGMAVDYKAGWDGHDARQKCGIITAAQLDAPGKGQRLMVSGFMFARDYPEFHALESRFGTSLTASAEGDMGMSYELADAHVADMRAAVWTLTRATFTGAAILLRAKAAYRATSFRMRGRK